MKLQTMLLCAVTLSAWGTTCAGPRAHNVILFVPDGLRASIVDPKTAPAMARLRDSGVNFKNSHSLFPTFTTANASVLATGHALADTGAYSNSILSPFPVKSAKATVTPFLETDGSLKELNAGYDHRLWNEDSLIALAAAAGYSTAIVGKVGPAADQDLSSLEDLPGRVRTLIVDDLTGHENGVELSAAWRSAFERAYLPTEAPARGDNGNFGAFDKPGTKVPGEGQQTYFRKVATEVVLPQFQASRKPFFLIYWSRDPDGTQHNQGDSFRAFIPGINGPTSLAAIRSVDDTLAALQGKLRELKLDRDTDILVVSDHGFSTLTRESRTSPASRDTYPDIVKGDLPLGFLSIDLARALRMTDDSVKLYDPDGGYTVVGPQAHPVRGNGLIGANPANPQVIVAMNGGSDLIYIPEKLPAKQATRVAHAVIEALLQQDYTSGIFVDERRFGRVAGALSLEQIAITGGVALTPAPAVVVSFRSFTTSACGAGHSVLCAVEVSDYFLQPGQGMHGTFSRADTWNFMAAQGPDFKARFVDPLPTSNADIGITIAHLLGVKLHPKGPWAGRVLSEALRGGSGGLPRVVRGQLVSAAASNGLRTILKTQAVGGHVYWDAAGFPGRTIGLE